MSNTTVWSSILRNCVPLSAVSPAKQTHAQIIVNGLLHNVTLQTDLLLVYSKCGILQDARNVFDKMFKRNMHSWNIMIASYVQNSLFYDALSVFRWFLKVGNRPDHYTLPPVFKACTGRGEFSLGVMLHSWVIRLGFENYVVVGSSVLDFYLKCRHLDDAKRVFVNMLWRDTVVWNLMISGFGRAGFHVDALNFFRDMLGDGVEVDAMTIPSILNVCVGEGDLMRGKEIHGQVVKSSLFDGDVVIGNSLIDMYAKCGCLCFSEKVFLNMSQLNLVTWTTMISCYGLHGRGEESLVLFKEMRDRGFVPNSVTLTAILASCSHSGLIEQGRKIFNSIGLLYGFEPTVEHYACMVDLLGRFGYLEEAFELVKNMKLVPTGSIWGALLAGCIVHKNVVIGEIAAHHLFELEPRNPSNYIALCSIYDSLGMWDGISRTRAKMRELGLVKTSGCSWINVSGKVHKFYQGDLSPPLSQMIYETLDGIVMIMMSTED
ncbi:pentatricopeptide repeat-containing protein At5g04780, mitochondrial-like [Cornus florida]|uniref:pentatricopeptide repeat-containing protein At5g04780, mitochondrial-like n=1 Tax=Cornus florida TaxID=4283 RepID=UPI00289BB7CD|nr:pentatricopeptide repeat-containing protein At5g04780, mitochondrial-like [Cornus florida]